MEPEQTLRADDFAELDALLEIDQALEEDEPRARAEYLAEIRRDVEAVEAVVIPDRRELPPMEGVRFHAFCDPSGGSSDSMTLAIVHEEKRELSN